MPLLHHFTISTSLTLSRDPSFQKFWQITVVQLGFTEKILLHGILSVSALHLAHISQGDTRSYFSDAAKHHDIALSGFQEALQELDPKRYDALFASAILLFDFVFAYIAGDSFGSKT